MEPSSSQQDISGQGPTDTHAGHRREHGSMIGGIVLILIGLLFLLERFVPDVRFGDYWPLILVVIGGWLLWNSRRPQ
jgi:LiaI-LiaF-like transmembrane region